MEEEREGEKNKWLAFNSKVCVDQEFIVQSSQSTAWGRVLCADCSERYDEKYLSF
jgi:hypothetical protein